jgi:hypothetical protein
MEEAHVPQRVPMEGKYVNHFQIGYNAFEFVIDFSQAHDNQVVTDANTRVITTPAYAKLLSAMLDQSIHQYEEKFEKIPNVVER